MSRIILNNAGLTINMSIDGKGSVSGEVYEDNNRFASIDFKASINGDLPGNGGPNISVQLPGVSVQGNAVPVMFHKLDMAREYANNLHDLMLNFSESSDYFLNSVKSRIKAKDVDSLVLFLALTPLTIDSEAVKEALIESIESGLLGDVTSEEGLKGASDNVFSALYSAVLGKVGSKDIHPLEEDRDSDPNEVMASYLRELQAA